MSYDEFTLIVSYEYVTHWHWLMLCGRLNPILPLHCHRPHCRHVYSIHPPYATSRIAIEYINVIKVTYLPIYSFAVNHTFCTFSTPRRLVVEEIACYETVHISWCSNIFMVVI